MSRNTRRKQERESTREKGRKGRKKIGGSLIVAIVVIRIYNSISLSLSGNVAFHFSSEDYYLAFPSFLISQSKCSTLDDDEQLIGSEYFSSSFYSSIIKSASE